MPRFLVALESGVSPSSVRPILMSQEGVQDATPSRTFNGLIVDASTATKSELASIEGVAQVYEDIQAIPQVASEKEREDFLKRVKEIRGGDVAPLAEMEPVSGDDDLQADGAGTTLPTLTQEQQFADGEPQVSTLSEIQSISGSAQLHEQGIVGNGAVGVVIDTGVCGDQFESERRLQGVDLTGNDPWSDYLGHGSMTAGIMAGGEQTDAANPGYAPGMDVYPIKSTLAASELIQAMDKIADLRNEVDKQIIVNNSWGFPQCTGLCDHPITRSVAEAAKMRGVTMVFAAGNQGEACGQECTDTGISGPASLDSVISVAATGHNGNPTELMPYSSRGGERASCGRRKPEISAPIYGEVPWKCGSKNIGNGGGTSAATPQVAGLAGLVASMGDVTTKEISAAITGSANQFRGTGWNGCTGYGNIDAVATVGSIPSGLSDELLSAVGVAAAGAAGALGSTYFSS